MTSLAVASASDKTKVSELMGVAWDTVGNIVARVVHDRLDPSRLDGLRRIGVDELSHHRPGERLVDARRRSL